jgi:Pentapeptide repeats (8 copies)
VATSTQRKLAQKRLANIRRAKNARFKWTGLKDKTLWDWMQLLIIPLVLATGGFVFSAQQHDIDQQRTLDQQQATILQTYIDNIQTLLLNYKLQESKQTDEVAIVARARTLTALQGLDPERRGRLVQFIYEAQLIGFKDRPGNPTLDLSSAIFYGAILYGAHLEDAHLEGTHLEGAHLDGATLNGIYLDGAHLDGATITSAYLSSADLRGATLNGTHLAKTILSSADLRGATLNGTDFSGAILNGADLRYATLYNATLNGTRFSDANITQQQLDQASTCKDAILPQGLTCHRTS